MKWIYIVIQCVLLQEHANHQVTGVKCVTLNYTAMSCLYFTVSGYSETPGTISQTTFEANRAFGLAVLISGQTKNLLFALFWLLCTEK